MGTLTWFQMFCMNKAGADDHVPWAWACQLGDVHVGQMKPVPWDIIHMSDLNGDEKDVNASKALQAHLCTSNFFSRHVMYGDSPKDIPFGNIEKFREDIAKEMHALHEGENSELEEAFDEYT